MWQHKKSQIKRHLNGHNFAVLNFSKIRVITKLPNSEQSYKGKVKTHKYINRQNQYLYASLLH